MNPLTKPGSFGECPVTDEPLPKGVHAGKSGWVGFLRIILFDDFWLKERLAG
jgi:hypothetical protein